MWLFSHCVIFLISISVRDFQLFHFLTLDIINTFHFSHSNGYLVMFLYNLKALFPITNDVEHFCMMVFLDLSKE